MQQKVLVLGATGLIGHQIYNYLEKNSDYELVNITHKTSLNQSSILCDVRNEELFVKTVTELNPDIIINCIGILIEGANRNPENAIFINAYMPHRLTRLANNISAKLIHISTDCVFSGEKKEPYREDDIKDGKDTYAKTKGLGEVISDRHLTLRTSVVGPELKADGEELFHWFMMQEGTIQGYTRAIWSGVTTIELAKAVHWAIKNNTTGLHHITNNKSICKYDLLNLFKRYTKKNIDIVAVNGKEVDKSFVDTRNELDYVIPSFSEMIRQMINMIRNNPKTYKQYMKYINE